MEIENELKRIELPKIYKREGKDCYYDTYRKTVRVIPLLLCLSIGLRQAIIPCSII